MTNSIVIDADGTFKEHKPQRFQFKLDEARNSMVFGKGGYFNNKIKPIDPALTLPSDDFWTASEGFFTLTYRDGKFLYSYNMSYRSITAITADCDKF